MKSHNLILSVFVLFSLSFYSCSSEELEVESIMNKWWYEKNENASPTDLYFGSDGTFQQMAGTILHAEGDWVWENEEDNVFKIMPHPGQNLLSVFYLRISDIEENSIMVQNGFSENADYTVIEKYLYEDFE